MEAAHISPELPIRWFVSADRTVEIKEEVTELGCDQANERILQEETPPSSITERDTDIKLAQLATNHPCVDSGAAKTNTCCPPKRVPSADRFFSLCMPAMQKTQSYSVRGQRSSGQLTGKPADELASTIEHAVKAAVDTVLCEITKVVGGKFTEFRMEMAGKEKENESLKLRLEISESELKAVRECKNAADADIKQPLRNMNPDCNEHDFQRNQNQGLFQGNQTRGTPFPCADSGKSFSRSSQLKIHQHIHTEEKPYHCTECGKRFTRLAQLKIHQRVHTGEKPYHCTKCGRRFSCLSDFKRHQRIHTGEKPHHCSECGMSFTRLGSLQSHQRIHTGEKPYHCPECGKNFTYPSSLKVHQRAHKKEKSYQCSECLKKFSHLSNLKRHHRIHTRVEPYPIMGEEVRSVPGS
ncbi:UNVERIFIED_CONTAM: hypothetical protein FKN15_074879 [Acipenser sinensis]